MEHERPHATIQGSTGVWAQGLKSAARKAMGTCTHEHPHGNRAQWQEAFTLRRDTERTVVLST